MMCSVLILPLLYLLYDHPVCMMYYGSGKNSNTFLIAASLSIALIGFRSWRISFWSVVYHQWMPMALELRILWRVKYGSFVSSNSLHYYAKRSLDFLQLFFLPFHTFRTSFVRSQPMSIKEHLTSIIEIISSNRSGLSFSLFRWMGNSTGWGRCSLNCSCSG